MVKPTNKIAYLDGIRGSAAFFVVLHHFLLAFYSAYFTFKASDTNLNGLDIKYGQSVFSVFSNGHFCVCVFFVLSGFVLSRKYFLTGQFEVIVSGAQRRFLRLYIPVAATMILSFALMSSGMRYNIAAGDITHSAWWLGKFWIIDHPLQKLWYCLKVGTMFFGDATFDTSLWTMAIELTGSFFVFAFLAFTHQTRDRFFMLVLVFLYCKFTNQFILSSFVLGISLNYVERLTPSFNKAAATVAAILLILPSLVLGSYPPTNNVQGTIFEHAPAFLMQYSDWFHVIGAYFLVTAFVISAPLQRLISMRLFRFLGYISFSLYLLHPLIIGSFSCFVFLRIYEHFGYNSAVLIVFALTIPVCLLLSWLMARFIDDPGIRFSKYVYNRWIKKRSVAQPAEAHVSEKTK